MSGAAVKVTEGLLADIRAELSEHGSDLPAETEDLLLRIEAALFDDIWQNCAKHTCQVIRNVLDSQSKESK